MSKQITIDGEFTFQIQDNRLNIKTSDCCMRISNIDKYDLKISNNTFQLTRNGSMDIIEPEYSCNDENEFLQFDLQDSEILDTLILDSYGSESQSYKSYMGILIDMWKYFPREKILDTKSFEVLPYYKNDSGYCWCQKFQVSYLVKSPNVIMQEIFKIFNYSEHISKIIMKVRLKNGDIIKYATADGFLLDN